MPNVKAQSSKKYQITKCKVGISFDIWILAFDILSWHLNSDIWNCYLGGSREFGRLGVGKNPKVRKLFKDFSLTSAGNLN
jgi:hypothetical protein